MRLIDAMRSELEEARVRGRHPDHWEIAPDALERLKSEAPRGELAGSEMMGTWSLDGVSVRASNVPGEGRYVLVLIEL